MSTLRRFAGQTLIYGLSTIIARIMNFILTPLLTFRLTPAKYGIFGYLYSGAAMINAFLAFGMETTFFRYLQKQEKEKEKVYANSFIVILCASALLLLTALFCFDVTAAYLQRSLDDPDLGLYLKLFIVILIADALAVIPFARIRAEGRPLRFAFIKLTNIVTSVGGSLFFLIVIPWLLRWDTTLAPYFSWYKEDWVGYVFISNLAASLLTLFMLLPEMAKLQLRPDRKLINDMLRYSFPVLIANFSFIINEHLDKLLLQELLPAETSTRDVGIYTACSKLAIFMSIAVQAFRLGAEPFFFSYAKEKNARQTYALIMDYLVIAMALAAVALTANIEILKYFIRADAAEEREAYWSGLPVVPVLLIAYVFLGIYMNLSIWYKLSDQTKYGLYISGIGALLTIVLNLVLIPRFGYMASAWVTLATYGSMMVASYVMGQKNYPIPYRALKNSLYLIAAMIISWVSFSLFDRDLVAGNLLFAAFVMVTVWLERKQLGWLIRK